MKVIQGPIYRTRIGAAGDPVINVGTRKFVQAGNKVETDNLHIVVSGPANGKLPGALIPYPPCYGPNAPVGNWADPNSGPYKVVTAPNVLQEYVAVVAASLGDGCGYSQDEINVRIQDLIDWDIVIPTVSELLNPSTWPGWPGVSQAATNNAAGTAAQQAATAAAKAAQQAQAAANLQKSEQAQSIDTTTDSGVPWGLVGVGALILGIFGYKYFSK